MTEELTERIEVRRAIAADPPPSSPCCAARRVTSSIDASGMLMAGSGEPATAVGDTFVIHMDREALNDYPLGLYDVEVHITAFEQDREIAWTIVGQIKPQIGHVYGYRLEPFDGGTIVTSYYDWSDDRSAVAGGRHLPGDLGARPPRHPRDPRPHGGAGPAPAADVPSTKRRTA